VTEAELRTIELVLFKDGEPDADTGPEAEVLLLPIELKVDDEDTKDVGDVEFSLLKSQPSVGLGWSQFVTQPKLACSALISEACELMTALSTLL
jgi:hypothetical protein